jgi:hypothetical protein
MQHGLVGHCPRLLDAACFQMQLRLEDLPLTGGQLEIDWSHHFAGALALPCPRW